LSCFCLAKGLETQGARQWISAAPLDESSWHDALCVGGEALFMSVIDVDKLLAPISPEMPSGENLEYDADYAAMEKAAAGTPEQQFGTTVIPGKSRTGEKSAARRWDY
jgi:hypothetical protein